MTAISKGELSSFLNQGTFTAKLATVKEDGITNIMLIFAMCKRFKTNFLEIDCDLILISLACLKLQSHVL